MKKLIAFAIIIFTILPSQGFAAVSTWQTSASFQPKNTTDFSSDSFKQSLRNFAGTHGNSATLIIPYYQSSLSSSDIQSGYNTPTDASLISAIDFAHTLGLSVILKPHLECWCGEWRAQINASDRNSWYANYSAMLNHLATIGQAHGVSQIVIGTELIRMSSGDINPDNTVRWNSIIASVRSIFKGSITYSANWGETGFVKEIDQVKFWNNLDDIGISAYFSLKSGTNSVADITSQWDYWNNNYVKPLNQSYGKPVLFTETGYRSVANARFSPWDYNQGGGYDGTEQANLYDAMFTYWNNQAYMQGLSLWAWDTDPNAGYPGNTDYTPQNKPAQAVLAKWFANPTPPGNPPPPPPQANLTFTSSATVSSSPQVNQPLTVTANVKNTSASAASNVLVDVEIYNSSNSKLKQVFFSNQNFTAGQSQSYPVNWTPTSTGNYSVKIGVFNSDWSTNYIWNDSAATFNVGTTNNPPPPPTTPPPPATTQLDIWWPSNGSSVQGLQPFKAMLENMDVTAYDMYWQVDGDVMNLMANNAQDYPHKESLVDVSSWTWRGAGPYTINFVAKDKNGNILAQKSISITVVQ